MIWILYLMAVGYGVLLGAALGGNDMLTWVGALWTIGALWLLIVGECHRQFIAPQWEV